MTPRDPLTVLGTAVALALALAMACGDGEEEVALDAIDTTSRAGGLAEPPSAAAPRAAAGGAAPDTLRPTPAEVPAETPGARPREPGEFDLQAIADAYARYYTEFFYEEGSEVTGGIDPRLERNAKRQTALDWGYVREGAWTDMVGDMTRDQQVVLADRIVAANADLARRLHGTGAL